MIRLFCMAMCVFLAMALGLLGLDGSAYAAASFVIWAMGDKK